MRPSVLVISGPTASGKSELAVRLATAIGGEIISADSVSVYAGFDIASGKPDEHERRGVPHALLSQLSPGDSFDAGQFVTLAGERIRELNRMGRQAVVAGGSSLYIRSLLCGIVPAGPVTAEAQQRLAELEQRSAEAGEDVRQALYGRLQQEDPGAAARLHFSDVLRVKRALLVKFSTGRQLSALQDEHRHGSGEWRALVIVLLPRRDRLYEAIDRRVDRMLSRGALEETHRLLEFEGAKALGAIGYRHLQEYLQGRNSWERTKELFKRDTRRFAKRQFTWWRNQPEKLGWPVRQVSCSDRSLVEIAQDALVASRLFLGGEAPFAHDGVQCLFYTDFDPSRAD